MTIQEFLTLATQVTIVFIAAITVVNFLRHRDQTRLDIALLFCALAFIIAVGRISQLPGITDAVNRGLGLATQMALMAHPYLFLRLVQDFRPVSPRIRGFAWIGMLVSWVSLLVFAAPLPLPVTLSLVAYFVFVELYATVAFAYGARSTVGVTSWRLTLAAAGSGLLALVIFASGLASVLPAAAPVIGYFNQIIGLLSMLSYYFGFATPQWLRHYWQLSELQRFLKETRGPWAGESVSATLERLCRISIRAVGGVAALVALWDESKKELVIQAATHPVLLTSGLHSKSKPLQQLWATQNPIIAQVPRDFSVQEAPLTAAIGAKATMLIPIKTEERNWGVLQVFNWRSSLFASDDINLLALFAEQTAIALSYATLVTGQQNLIQQLSQRTTQLEIAYKELEAFSYSVSHDLRAPLRHISGYIELLEKHAAAQLDEKSRRYMSVIQESNRRMGILIDALLAFSRFGRTEMHHTEIDLGQLVEEVIAEFESDLIGRDIDWHIQPLPQVHGDRTLLRLVLSNLISNALKFSRSRPRAKIEIGYTPGQNETVFFVRDNGTGFDMQFAGQLFGVFQRLHSATEFEGIGIGLANVRRIIQRHDGQTWAEGMLDEGATFYFSLPNQNAGPTKTQGEVNA